MKKIAITGVMGAGKSSAIEMIKALSYTVLDCDRINAELLKKNHEGYQQLLACFGDTIMDEAGNIDRKKMSTYIFADSEKKAKAEAILHPLIQQKLKEELCLHQDEDKVFVEVPLLFEIRWEAFFDEIWVVASEECLRVERLMKYRGVSEEEARIRLAHQMSQQEKVDKADIVLWNNSNKEHLKQQIYDILNR